MKFKSDMGSVPNLVKICFILSFHLHNYNEANTKNSVPVISMMNYSTIMDLYKITFFSLLFTLWLEMPQLYTYNCSVRTLTDLVGTRRI
jgi:hypothetical protein